MQPRGALIVLTLIATASAASAAEPPGAASDALAALRARNESLRVLWSATRAGAPELLTGLHEATSGEDAQSRAMDFLRRWPALLGISADDLAVDTVRQGRHRRVVVLRQMHGGVPIRNRSVSVTLDEADRVRAVTSDVVALETVARATIDAEEARRVAERATGAMSAGARRVVAATGARGVEAFEVTVMRAGLLDSYVVLVDAHTGRVFCAEKVAVH